MNSWSVKKTMKKKGIKVQDGKVGAVKKNKN